jgi:transposase
MARLTNALHCSPRLSSGAFAELGIAVAQGDRNTRQPIAYLQDETNPDFLDTPPIALQPLVAMLIEIEAQIEKLDKAILAAHRSDPVSIRLATISKIGNRICASCLWSEHMLRSIA